MPDKPDPIKLILHCPLSPGDVMTLTAAIESLHAAYPGEYLTDVRTTAPEIWDHNPHITKIADGDRDAMRLHMEYPQIHHSSERAINFLGCYTEYLSAVLKRPIPLITNRPHLYLSDEEKGWMTMPQEHYHGGRRVPYAIVVAGTKNDYTTKQWPVEHFQAVVDATLGKWQWVQIGDDGHDHPRLKNVIDLVGKTNHRMLHRLVYHCQAGIGPVTYLLHLCAAFEKPYVYLAGGREPVTWISYPRCHVLHTMGALPCCQTPCWRSRVIKLGDGDSKDAHLCDRPIVGITKPAAQCMAMIKPEQAISILGMYS